MNPSEELLERLAAPDVTADTVLEYLWAQHDELMRDYEGPPPISPSVFFNVDHDLPSFRLAMDWWPRMDTLPPALAAPSLYQLLWRYEDATPGATFAQRLAARSEPAIAWLQANGFSVTAPNGADHNRRKRQATERQRRHRARTSTATDPALAQARTHAQAVKVAYDAYMLACRQRKEAAAQWDAHVKAAHDAWVAVKNNPPESLPTG